MRNLLNNPKVVGALCVLAIIMVYFRLFDSKPKYEPPEAPIQAQTQPSEPEPSPSVPEVQTAEAAPIPEQAAQPIAVGWPEKLARDPFLRHGQDSQTEPLDLEDDEIKVEDEDQDATHRALRLHAVFLDGPNKVAMINRQLVKEGEQIEGYVVQHIQQERVQLKNDEDTLVLEFGASTQDQPSST